MNNRLEGIKIIETATAIAGPMTGRLLSDWGADVVRVEHVVRKTQMEQRRAANSRIMNHVAQNINRNKRSIELNLSTDIGREIIYRMLAQADVLLSNFRPYELEKFKLDYDTLSRINPKLISAHLTGYGRKGPDKNAPAYGPVAGDSRAGFVNSLVIPGQFLPRVSGQMTDNITGLSLACGILAALFSRERTGLGQEVDVSLFQSIVFTLSGEIASTFATGQEPGSVDRKDVARPLTSSYKTKDGRWLMIWLGETPAQVWAKFCYGIGREELINDPRFSSAQLITQNYSDLYDILDGVFATRTLDEWKLLLKDGGFPWSPVQGFLEVIQDPQARANDFFISLNQPSGDSMEVVANPIKLSRIPEIIRMPAPEVGQHTDQILREYGYSAEDIAKFRKEDAIG
jgi:crotonobetainyl-CoA:carnitine CoA-transferase CaiB-like acyl-CoA transferase